jgi:hypothetical protein
MIRAWGALAFLALSVVLIPRAAFAGRPEPAQGKRPLLIVMNEVVEGLLPKILAAPSETTHRLTVGNGLLGLGPHEPRGGSDGGAKVPPRNLFSRAGLGNSLNVDPVRGRNYLANTP